MFDVYLTNSLLTSDGKGPPCFVVLIVWIKRAGSSEEVICL